MRWLAIDTGITSDTYPDRSISYLLQTENHLILAELDGFLSGVNPSIGNYRLSK
jgi:hypothetical protein